MPRTRSAESKKRKAATNQSANEEQTNLPVANVNNANNGGVSKNKKTEDRI